MVLIFLKKAAYSASRFQTIPFSLSISSVVHVIPQYPVPVIFKCTGILQEIVFNWIIRRFKEKGRFRYDGKRNEKKES